MSVEVFCYRLGKTQLAAADRKWMPLWLEKYASTATRSADGSLVLTRESVFDFLVKLKKGGTPAWQRLQAARTLEWYQKLLLDRSFRLVPSILCSNVADLGKTRDFGSRDVGDSM